jgi:Holliday junction resolvasome RuvABC ATP-dependent DNA helicase subunit
MANELLLMNKIITEQYFNLVKEFANKFVFFINKIKSDSEFINRIGDFPEIPMNEFETSNDFIDLFFGIDLVKGFGLISDFENLSSKESFALIYINAKSIGLGYDEYESINVLYNNGTLSVLDRRNKFLYEQSKIYDSDEFTYQICTLLSLYDDNLRKEYLTHLYQFLSIVVKADGIVTNEEEEILLRIMNLSFVDPYKDIRESYLKNNSDFNIVSNNEAQTIEEVLLELESLVGLENVKQEIKILINFLVVQKARESNGLKSTIISHHIVFTGNPGTGKTIVARILAKIYKILGIVSEGQLVETDRSGLIGEYIGHTAIKVNNIINSAINGILFIDEAYSISNESQSDFGKEAVATLIKRMEDDRDKLIVIIAGYTSEMNLFIESNPGFKSRFNRYFEFEDYLPQELFLIYHKLCKSLDYTLTNEAKEKILLVFEIAYSKKDKTFGNGRFVRNIFEKTLELQANRIASIGVLTREILTTITIHDIPL